jgi:hypothetical protein
MDVADIAVEAARAMDVADYAKVRLLYDRLIEDGHDETTVTEAFCSEGANLLNIPTQTLGGCYMQRAMRDPAYI